MKKHEYKSLYDKDFYAWSLTQVEFLRKGQFEKVDFENVIEEIESLGAKDKREAEKYLINLIMHRLKKKYQPNKFTKSWDTSIRNRKRDLRLLFKSNSLKNKIKNEFKENYEYARKDASEETGLPIETFPKESPWTFDELLGE